MVYLSTLSHIDVKESRGVRVVLLMNKFRKRIVIWLNYHGTLKLVMSAILVGLMIFIFTYELPAARTWTYWTLPLSGKTIAIDAGHGGPDGGAVSKNGIVEKDVTLAISHYLRDYLQQAGAIVVMTREDDRDLASPETKGLSKRKTEDLHTRADLIESSNADSLISIHLNSIGSSRWRGAQTFYHSLHPGSKVLAEIIQHHFRQNLGNTTRSAAAEDTVFLIKSINIPSVLVEVGFLSNPEEAALLADSQYQQKIAISMYESILSFYVGEQNQTP